MKGDFSRNTFNPKKHYSSVLKQQGRVDVDADWNEQQAILLRRIETEAIDVIGACGAPLHDAGFAITLDDKGVLRIGAGRYYVDGILCENETDGLDYRAQQDCPGLPALIDLLTNTRFGIVYLDVWQRHITALDDPLIREKALGGPDTATRLKTIWQVKVLPVRISDLTGPGIPPNCDTDYPAWDSLIAPSTGTLNARTQPQDFTERDCLLPPSAGYQRLENQLYRVEIHQGTASGLPTFVWSRDNGTVVTSIKSFSGTSVVVGDVGPDDILGFANEQWVEVIDDNMELNGIPGQLLQIDKVEEAIRTITMKTAVPVLDMNAHPKLRRWDQSGDPATVADGTPITFDWQPLEGGIEVLFARTDENKIPLTYKPGDYWLIPARTATGEIEWPQFEIPNTDPRAQPPAGIRHHYCRLALAQIVGEKSKILQDCRKIFPPLTELNSDQCCAISLRPDQDWKAALASLKPPSPAHICFQVGEYFTDVPIELTGFKSLKITGGGQGTRIKASSEAAFIFTSCQSVEVSDLYGETAASVSGTQQKTLSGVLTFYGCGSVSIDSVGLKGSDWVKNFAATRAASCICVEPQSPKRIPPPPQPLRTTSVRIRHCDLTVGNFQVGILIVDAERTQVDDNVLKVNLNLKTIPFRELLDNSQIRANIRRLLVSHPILQATPEPEGKSVSSGTPVSVPAGRRTSSGLSKVTVVAGKTTLLFDTPHALRKVLPALLAAEPVKPGLAESPLVRLNRIADRILVDPKFRHANRALNKWFKGLAVESESAQLPASQGIVVAGSFANEVRIRDNTVIGTAQGIHVGLSHKNAVRSHPRRRDLGGSDVAVSVSITGNRVDANSSDALQAHEGIFVGNCDNLIIEANRLVLSQRTSSANIYGIRVYGWTPSLVIIRNNHMKGFSKPGILFQPLGQLPKFPHSPDDLPSLNLIE